MIPRDGQSVYVCRMGNGAFVKTWFFCLRDALHTNKQYCRGAAWEFERLRGDGCGVFYKLTYCGREWRVSFYARPDGETNYGEMLR